MKVLSLEHAKAVNVILRQFLSVENTHAPIDGNEHSLTHRWVSEWGTDTNVRGKSLSRTKAAPLPERTCTEGQQEGACGGSCSEPRCQQLDQAGRSTKPAVAPAGGETISKQEDRQPNDRQTGPDLSTPKQEH